MTATSEDTNKKRRFRMVALDLDGTLLNSNHDISDATIAYLRTLHERGFIVAIATGRSAACTAHIIDKLDCLSMDDVGGDDGDDVSVDDIEASSAPAKSSAQGFPLVCSNGARGLRIVRKSYSDVDHYHSSLDVSAVKDCAPATTRSPHRSNTVPLESVHQHKSSPNNPTNPFLKQTLLINQELFHNPLPKEMALKTLALAQKLGCVTNYYHNHHIYAVVRNEEQMELTKRYAKLTGSTELYCYLNNDCATTNNASLSVIEGDHQLLYNEDNAYGYKQAMELGPPSKLLILCNTDKLDETTALVQAELNGTNNDDTQQQAKVIRGSPPFFVEILSPTVHKGHGLRQLCESLLVPLEEVVAFGDGDNDLEFIQMAGWGVAMKNGRGNVKESADEVTKWSNDEDGVIKTLQQYELEGRLIFPEA